MSAWGVDIVARVGAFSVAAKAAGALRPVAVFGANGAGKSTLLRAIAGLAPTANGVIHCGSSVWQDDATFVPCEERRAGWLPQAAPLFPHLSALDNVAMGRWAEPEAARRWMSALGVGHLERCRVAHMSGGQRRRVALAQVFANEPRWLLLDEPFSELDAAARGSLQEVLLEWAAQVPVWFTAHSLLEAHRMSADIMLLDKGELLYFGDIAGFLSAPTCDHAAALAREWSLAAAAAAR